jgi:hypothetical protein
MCLKCILLVLQISNIVDEVISVTSKTLIIYEQCRPTLPIITI